ncbi:MAG: EAL domain-containing protein [Methylophilus sp.]
MQTQNLNILIAEDDDFQRSIMVEMLNSLGHTSIYEAKNGLEALEIIRNGNPKNINLIFSDLKMPGMDGMEFLRYLGEEGHQLEIVILSAMDKKLLSVVNKISDIYKIKLLDALEKPLGLQQLKSVLAKSGKTSNQTKPTNAAEAHSYSVEEIMEGIRQKQFKPFLQPKVDLNTGKIIGAEALARWIHPEHGIVAPYAFIQKLEDSQKIDDLTFLMLEEAATVCKTLLEKNHHIHIAVNLSLVSLNEPQMAQKISNFIKQHGGDPKYFTLEITESTAMTDEPLALENLARLYMDGFTLSIDDYGTGYSNLQQLTRIAFGELKIDRSLIHGFTKNEAMRIIVASNIDMAHKLKIKSVAEGIETEQDWELLRKMGCDIGQGYLIAKPMSIVDFYKYIEEYRHQPIHTSPSMVQHYIKEKTKGNGEYKILVVEDDDFTRNVILQTLTNLGYQQAIGAENAQAAIDLFGTTQFDLVMTDIFMPDMNGLEFVKRIRTGKTLAKANSRIIVLSGVVESKVVGIGLALNVNGFIVKPLIPNVVDDKIRGVIAHPSRTQNGIAYETIATDFQ